MRRPGKPATFETLARPHLGGLRRVAFRMTNDKELAAELTQEAFLRAYKAFDQFEQGTNFKAWIFRILTNLCTDSLRKKARSPFVLVDTESSDAFVSLAPEAEQPDIRLINKQLRHDVSRAILNLSPEVRIVVALSLLKEFSYQEIADNVGCPVGTVRSRLSRGRAQLQLELKDHMNAHVTVRGDKRHG